MSSNWLSYAWFWHTTLFSFLCLVYTVFLDCSYHVSLPAQTFFFLPFSFGLLFFLSVYSFSLLLITIPWPLFSLPTHCSFLLPFLLCFPGACFVPAPGRVPPVHRQGGRLSARRAPQHAAQADSWKAALRSPHSSHGWTDCPPHSEANSQSLTSPHGTSEN